MERYGLIILERDALYLSFESSVLMDVAIAAVGVVVDCNRMEALSPLKIA